MGKWTPELLARMRLAGDDEADTGLHDAMVHGDIAGINRIFGSFSAQNQGVAADAPQSFRDFLDKTRKLPAGLDCAKATRGGEVMLEHATLCSLALLLASLPYGYAAPRLAIVLHMTQNLERRTYLRTLGVLQMLVNISGEGAFQPDGAAVVTAQKLRLLHAGVRNVVRREQPGYQAEFGMPLSQLDLVFTLMTFSLVVIDGVHALGARWDARQVDDYFYMWRMYGLLIGIEAEFLPDSLAEGRAFCREYEKEFRPAAENPCGVKLARADLQMMRQLMPAWLKWVGLRPAPKIYLLRMIGKEGAARVGIHGNAGSLLLQWVVLDFPAFLHRLLKLGVLERGLHVQLSRLFFKGLIEAGRGGPVTFKVPTSLEDLRRLDLAQPPRPLPKAAEAAVSQALAASPSPSATTDDECRAVGAAKS